MKGPGKRWGEEAGDAATCLGEDLVLLKLSQLGSGALEIEPGLV